MRSPLIDNLVEALRCMPGIGPKSAQRIAFHLLERNRNGARFLAKSLNEAMDGVKNCSKCRDFTEKDICRICSSTKRDQSTLCIVESPADVSAIEQSASYSGAYFVLMGKLSPIDGVGPDQIGLDLLEQRLQQEQIQEIILATNPTVEGEATAHYISEMAKKYNVKTTRIAHGVPLGGELEFVDGGTLAHAFIGRREY